MLPHDFSPWQAVCHSFRLWRLDGAWEAMYTALREQLRVSLDREPMPSAAILDSQSVKTAEKGAARLRRGKRVKGRKRQLLVDTEGLLLRVVVHAADVQDRDGGQRVLAEFGARFPRLQHLWRDAHYRGPFVLWGERTLGWSVDPVQHWWTGHRGVWVLEGQAPPVNPRGFQVLPHRWVVERTFAWLGKQRRLSKDDEPLQATSEALIYATMSGHMLATRQAH